MSRAIPSRIDDFPEPFAPTKTARSGMKIYGSGLKFVKSKAVDFGESMTLFNQTVTDTFDKDTWDFRPTTGKKKIREKQYRREQLADEQEAAAVITQSQKREKKDK